MQINRLIIGVPPSSLRINDVNNQSGLFFASTCLRNALKKKQNPETNTKQEHTCFELWVPIYKTQKTQTQISGKLQRKLSVSLLSMHFRC